MFEKWPYTNLYNLNLDWLVDTVKKLLGRVDTMPEEVKESIKQDLGEVYSSKNPPPYPVTSVNGDAGDVVVTFPVSSVNGNTGAVIVNAAEVAEADETPETMSQEYLRGLYANGVRLVACNPLDSGGFQSLYVLEKAGANILYSKFNPPGGGGGGAVDSVNGKTGVVILKVSDLQNDAGYITAATAPVKKVNGATGEITVNAADIAEGTETPETMTSAVLHSLYNHGVRVIGCLPNSDGSFNSLYLLEAVGDDIVGHKFTPPGGGGGGAVDSVNGKTGVVVLKVSDLQNDAGYVTNTTAPVRSVNSKTGAVSVDASVYKAKITPALFADGGTATITVSGIKAADNPVVSIWAGSVTDGTNPYSADTYEAIRDDFAKIWKITTAANSITVNVSGAILNTFYLALEVVR